MKTPPKLEGQKLTLVKKIRMLKFKIQNLKIKKKKWWDLLFDSILMSRDRAKPLSHWAEISSQDHFKIRASKPLSHWAAIRAIEPWFDQAKLRSKSPSQNPSRRAIELRFEPSRVEPRYLSYSFVTKLKGYIKNLHLKFEREC